MIGFTANTNAIVVRNLLVEIFYFLLELSSNSVPPNFHGRGHKTTINLQSKGDLSSMMEQLQTEVLMTLLKC